MTASERFKRWEESGWANCEVPNSAFLVEALDLLEKKEAGLIIELPVPIGSMIWVIDSLREPYEWKVTNFNVMEVVREWGKTVFPTREEAEAKLKEWKEKK